ncbi:3-epi-6-deoxocathasterone 23-monooxygenase [Glycine max]|nr:3-epi-6-deoxocathasterone 23-monooxygenase [Glycine max]
MDNIWIVFVTVFLLCTVILYRNRLSLMLKSKRKKNKLPLGTLGWPFIGETIEFVSCAYSDRPESFMDKRRRMYGKVFKSHIFGSPTIVSTDASVNKFILQSDAKVFVPSYPKSLTELMGESSILLINGSLQRRIHGLIGAFFKSQQLKAQITRDMQKYVKESMASWREDCPIYIQDETKKIAFHVLVKALISLDPGEDMELLKKHFQEFISGLMSLPIKLPGTKLYQSLQDSVPLLMTLATKYLSECPAALQQLTDKDTSSCNFTPFGGGQRLCPGLDLARLEASIFLHHFVTQFRWHAEKDAIVNFPTVRMKKRMPVKKFEKL